MNSVVDMEIKSNRWHLVMPLVFVTLYGSGFVGAKLGLPYAAPLPFLAWRFLIAAILLMFIAFFVNAAWPKKISEVLHMSMAGLLTIATFSAGTFMTIYLGVSPAISALIIALQPILVALGAGPILGEKITLRKWCGLFLGLMGVVLVVYHKVTFSHAHVIGVFTSVIGLLGLTAGNLYQKRFCSKMNIFTGGAIQALAAGIAMLVLGLIFESMHVEWTGQFIFALTWMTVVVSIGALSILYLLIRHQEASQVASIFYLVPVSTTILSFLLFKENIDLFAVMGIVITAFGVILANKGK